MMPRDLIFPPQMKLLWFFLEMDMKVFILRISLFENKKVECNKSFLIQFIEDFNINCSFLVVKTCVDLEYLERRYELRATSDMSQKLWPCHGEDPWLSSKGRTMGVEKTVLCSHGSSSIVWSENGPCCGTIAYFVGGKEGRIWFDVL